MSLRKLLSFCLALLIVALPFSAWAQTHPQQKQDFAREMERQAAELQATDPNYTKNLAQAETAARQAFAAKRLRDAALNTRGNDQASPAATIQSVPWDWLWVGDVMHINNKKFFNVYALYYSHSGTYNGNNTVYESNSDGVRLRPLSSWQQGQPVALGYTSGKSSSEVAAALNWAKNKYGTDGSTPYNWNFLNKTTDSALYCSQLVWKIHQNMGLNVDSNHWTYVAFLTAKFGAVGTTFAFAAVAPDEVYLSDKIIFYHAD
ncbi:MAG TPA: hypothetical protein DG577_10700 [Firmicutes bacterium]|jgi:hypothetical protein|nr:hypothetical protein [Bacillota bacterium]